MLDAPQKSFEKTEIKDRLRHCVLGSSFDLVFKPTNLLIQIRYARIGANPNYECRACTDGIPSDIQAAIKVVDDVHQSDGIDIKHCGGVGIIAHLRRIAGNADQVMQPDGCGTEEIGLNP